MAYRAPKRRTISEQWSARDMYPHRTGQTTSEIERAVVNLYPSQPFGTHGSVCADLLVHAIIQRGERAILHPALHRDSIIGVVLGDRASMVGTVLVYSRNNPATKAREPKPMTEQRAGFRRNLFASYPLAVAAIERVQAEAAAQAAGAGAGSESGAGGSESGLSQSASEAAAEAAAEYSAEAEAAAEAAAEPEPEPEGEKIGAIYVSSEDPLRAHHEWSRAVRAVMVERELSWSMRPTIDGIALIGAGCPSDAVRDACLMDYPDDLREQLGVRRPFDFAGFGVMDYLEKAASARVDDRGTLRPVCLAMVGPAGTGKTTAATVLAGRLDVQRYDVSMSGGTPMSAFYGIDRLNAELTLSDYERWALNGGIHLFDEMDCADPNLLKIVNKALANRDYTNPLSGKRIVLSPDAIAIAGMNTLGVGIQAEYSAAEQLDFSTIDRFRAGRVRVDIDETLETTIVDAQIAHIRA